jgi:beta-glucuronidase
MNRPFALRQAAALLCLLLVAAIATHAAADAAAPQRTRVDLSGPWKFALDYAAQGEANGWHQPGIDEATWDTVDVPHIWNLEPRFEFTGAGWYRKAFVAPAVPPAGHARFLFGAVFYKARVWLNGVPLGQHEGGYTAFTLDAGDALKPGQQNLLVVMVDNSWSTETLPGARGGTRPNDQTYPWWNYGGIKKPVHLELAPSVFIANQKLVATPNLESGTASVSVRVWLRNTAGTAQTRRVRVRLRRPAAWDAVGTAEASLRVPAQSIAEASLTVNLPAPVAFWDFDHPNLYESLVETFADAASAPADTHLARFGIRKLEIRDSRLFLNGESVSFGGANRVADHPVHGSFENDAVIHQDFSMMKSANMGLARILHYPPSPTLLDWADKHGFLIIAEPGNWSLPPDRMDSEAIRANWKRQTTEMIEQSWNHPSVIGWSVGNEYQSDTPSGVRWTRDMIAFVRTLDASRFTTFVSLGGKISSPVPPDQNSFHYADILCPNIYGMGGLAKAMETLAAKWPGKPVLITEYGWRHDASSSEAGRAQQFRDWMAILRKYPFVIGTSVWTWNDYRSRYPGTNPDGYRRWGVVTPDRTPRDSYFVLREELSPAVFRNIAIDRKPDGLMAQFAVRVTLHGRADFPARILRDHDLVVSLVAKDGAVRKQLTHRVPVLQPGQTIDVVVPVSPFEISTVPSVKVELRQPTGFVGLERTIAVMESASQ